MTIPAAVSCYSSRLGCMATALFTLLFSGQWTFADSSEIVVTGTRTPIERGKLAASSTVISRADIERLQVTDLPDLLRGIPGVDLVQSGGAGKLTSVFLRGTESDQVLVLVNGTRIGSASAGITAFELIPVTHIERIEIIRGPRASQWGSEAIGGVIQIFTVNGADNAGSTTRVGAGTDDTYRIAAQHGGTHGDSHYAVSAEYFDTGGFDARQPVPGPFGFDQPDDDGYDNASIHLRAGHRFSTGSSLEAFALHARGTAEFDGSFQDETDFVQQVLGGSLSVPLHDRLALMLRAGESRDETDNFAPDGSFSSRFDTRRRELSLQGDLDLSVHRITAGVDYRDDRLDSNSRFTETSRDNVGLFLQYLGDWDRFQFHGALRHDDNEAFGGETTGGLGASLTLSRGLRLYTTFGTAFKTPSFNELFFPDFGNPNLTPETSESYEVGIEGFHGWGTWAVRTYRNNLDDLIVTVSDPLTGTFFPDNVNRARVDGVELEITARLGDWFLAGTLSLLDPEDRDSGAQLARRTKKSLRMDASRRFGKWETGGRLLYQGDRYNDLANMVSVDGFTTVDLLASYDVNLNLQAQLKIGNLFDKDYQTVAGFNSDNRNVFFSLVYRDNE